MTQIILPDAAISQLAAAQDPVVICDAAGKVLGTFFPETEHDPSLYAGVESPLTPEERERRLREPGRKTLTQIWKELGRQ
jgi:CRISPR/Cas system-associated endonuclease Cas1